MLTFRELAQKEIDAAQAISASAEAASRELKDTELDAIEAHMAAHAGLIAKAERSEKVEAQMAAAAAMPAPVSRQTYAAPMPKVEVGQDLVLLDPKKGFSTPRDFFGAVMAASRGNVDSRLKPLAAVGSDEQQTQNDSLGGFLVPVGFSPTVLQLDPENDFTMGMTTNIPMTAPTIKIPARVDKVHTTSVVGGVLAYWKAETTAITDSKTTWEQITLDANTLSAATYTTNELLNDSPISVAALIADGFKGATGDKLLDSKINGTGVGQPMGVTASAAHISITRETTLNSIDGPDVIAMRARSWGYGNAIWVANHDCLPNLAEAHISGTNGDIFLFQPGRGIDVPDTLMGRPIIFTEYAASVASANSLMLINWKEYIMGIYQAMATGESIHVRFLENESCFKATMRLDGKPWWTSALTPKNGSNTLSPIVGLAAA